MPETDDIFITSIEIQKLRHLAKLTIPISGRNGGISF